MSKQTMIFLLLANVGIGVILIAFVVILAKQKKKDAKGRYRAKKRLISLRRYYKIYSFMDRNFLLRPEFRRVVSKVSNLSVYTPQEIKTESVKFYCIALISFLTLNLTGMVIFKDVFTSLLILLFSIVVKNVIITKQIDSVHFKVLKQLANAFSEVRQNFTKTENIPDAILESQVPPLIRRPFDEIYLILTSEDANRKLEEFNTSTPFRLLQTFAGVCYLLNETGDSKTDSGISNFIQSISMLTDEIHREITRIAKQKAKFGILEYLPIVPIPAMGGIESFFTSTIPGTSIIYKGTLGYVSRVIIIAAAILGYLVITKVNSAVTVNSDDRNYFIVTLLKNKKVARFIDNIKPKKFRSVLRKRAKLRGALSSKSLEQIYLAKVIWASFAVVFTLFSCYTSVELGKSFTYNNYAQLSLTGGEDLKKDELDRRKAFDKEFLARPEKPGRAETDKMIKSAFPKLSEFDRQDQVDRVLKKYESYHNAYFHWWFILIAYFIAMCTWFIPDLEIKFRAWIIKTESEEDVLQLQTMIAILMYTPIDTMDTLYWLQKQSRIHKNVLTECYHEYASDSQRALDKAKNDAQSPEFIRMMDKLSLTISKISLHDAFQDLVTEREYILKLRSIAQDIAISKKRMLASPLALMSMACVVILYVLVPIGILGYQEFSRALANIKM